MAKPKNSERRTAILGAFDKQPICSIRDIMKYVPDIKYQALRLTVIAMAEEGLLTELPGRGDRNTRYFTKAIFKNITRFSDYSGNPVSLKEFIHGVTTLESQLIDASAMKAIKVWMLDVLGSVKPEPYTSKNHSVPNDEELIKRLNVVLQELSKMHAFIKSFTLADIHSPVARERLAREFDSTCFEEHVVIVDRGWMENE